MPFAECNQDAKAERPCAACIGIATRQAVPMVAMHLPRLARRIHLNLVVVDTQAVVLRVSVREQY